MTKRIKTTLSTIFSALFLAALFLVPHSAQAEHRIGIYYHAGDSDPSDSSMFEGTYWTDDTTWCFDSTSVDMNFDWDVDPYDSMWGGKYLLGGMRVDVDNDRAVATGDDWDGFRADAAQHRSTVDRVEIQAGADYGDNGDMSTHVRVYAIDVIWFARDGTKTVWSSPRDIDVYGELNGLEPGYDIITIHNPDTSKYFAVDVAYRLTMDGSEPDHAAFEDQTWVEVDVITD